MDARSEIAFILKNARIKSGYSQNDVSEELGYGSAQFVSNWERAISKPPIETFKKLIAIYDIDIKLMENLYVAEETSALEEEIRAKFKKIR